MCLAYRIQVRLLGLLGGWRVFLVWIDQAESRSLSAVFDMPLQLSFNFMRADMEFAIFQGLAFLIFRAVRLNVSLGGGHAARALRAVAILIIQDLCGGACVDSIYGMDAQS